MDIGAAVATACVNSIPVILFYRNGCISARRRKSHHPKVPLYQPDAYNYAQIVDHILERTHNPS